MEYIRVELFAETKKTVFFTMALFKNLTFVFEMQTSKWFLLNMQLFFQEYTKKEMFVSSLRKFVATA
jgi:hypothetical protein